MTLLFGYRGLLSGPRGLLCTCSDKGLINSFPRVKLSPALTAAISVHKKELFTSFQAFIIKQGQAFDVCRVEVIGASNS